jgi:hypothetical protein
MLNLLKTLTILGMLGVVSVSLDSTDHNAISVLAPNPYIAFFLHPVLDGIGEGSYVGKEAVQIGGCFAQASHASDDDLVKMVAGSAIDVVDKLIWKNFFHAAGIAIQMDGPTTLALNLTSIGYVVGKNYKIWG